jgi:hypothetical protein
MMQFGRRAPVRVKYRVADCAKFGLSAVWSDGSKKGLFANPLDEGAATV